MSEDLLREATRRMPSCPELGILAADLALDPACPARAEAERHTATCPHCRTAIAMLREFEGAEPTAAERLDVEWITSRLTAKGAVKKQAPKRWRFGVPAVFGFSAAVAAVTLVLFAIPHRREPLPDFTGEPARSAAIEASVNRGVFEWKPVEGARSYELTVRTVDDHIVFHNIFTTTTLPFPQAVVAMEKTGKLLRWEVVARDVRGAEIARSGGLPMRTGR